MPFPSSARERQGRLKEAKGSQPSLAMAPASFGDEPEISALPATETMAPLSAQERLGVVVPAPWVSTDGLIAGGSVSTCAFRP